MYPERYTLKHISDVISPHLTRGVLELVVVAQEIPVAREMGICPYYERLVIRSNGSAERHYYWAHACTRGVMRRESEHYDPNTKKRAA